MKIAFDGLDASGNIKIKFEISDVSESTTSVQTDFRQFFSNKKIFQLLNILYLPRNLGESNKISTAKEIFIRLGVSDQDYQSFIKDLTDKLPGIATPTLSLGTASTKNFLEEASIPDLSSERSLKKIKVNTKEKNVVSIQTKGEGDCAFHSVLGEWNELEHMFVCPNVLEQRRQVGKAVRECKESTERYSLVIAGIKELMMRNQAVGDVHREILARYQDHLLNQDFLTPHLWASFEKTLHAYPVIVECINNHHQLAPTATFRAKFYDALNRSEDELSALIISIQELHDAFQEYNDLSNTNFDWGIINRDVITEYANFIEKPGQWLLVSELAIIADYFECTIIYYADPDAKDEPINLGKTIKRSVQFNGKNHYERVESRENLPSQMVEYVTTSSSTCNKPSLLSSSSSNNNNRSTSRSYRSNFFPINFNFSSSSSSSQYRKGQSSDSAAAQLNEKKLNLLEKHLNYIISF